MRKAILTLVTVALVAWPLPAQSSRPPRGWGYGFFAPGVTSPGGTGSVHLGVGGEGLAHKGLGVGAELGYLTPWRAFRGGLGTFSVNGSYHFLPRQNERRAVPFVTSGYTLMFRGGTLNLLNFGGGVNVWLRERVGLRLEVRDHVHPPSPVAHFVGFRVGVTFR